MYARRINGSIQNTEHIVATHANGRDPKAEEHLRISRQFLRQAQAEFARGDRLQASEKAWGVAAHAVKAVAQHRGWRHDGHRYLFEAIDKIYYETGDPEFLVLFKIANSLHTNFYENWQTDNSVQDGIERVEVLLEKLEPLLDCFKAASRPNIHGLSAANTRCPSLRA